MASAVAKCSDLFQRRWRNAQHRLRDPKCGFVRWFLTSRCVPGQQPSVPGSLVSTQEQDGELPIAWREQSDVNRCGDGSRCRPRNDKRALAHDLELVSS